jgi:hypothetical protein
MVCFRVLLIQLRGGPNINHRFHSSSVVLFVSHHGNVLKKPLLSIGHLQIVHMRGSDACKLMASRFFNVGQLVRSQFASGRSCDRPTRSRFSVVPEQILSRYPNLTLHCMLHMQPSNGNIKNFALM